MSAYPCQGIKTFDAIPHLPTVKSNAKCRTEPAQNPINEIFRHKPFLSSSFLLKKKNEIQHTIIMSIHIR